MTKIDSQVRILKRDLKYWIRDEIYGASHEIGADCSYIAIPKKQVAKIAKKIAARAIVGH